MASGESAFCTDHEYRTCARSSARTRCPVSAFVSSVAIDPDPSQDPPVPANDPIRFRTSRARARAVRSLVFMAFFFLVVASVIGSPVGYAACAIVLLLCAWAAAVLSAGRAPGDIEVGR